jgi:hypothetical protein
VHCRKSGTRLMRRAASSSAPGYVSPIHES